MFGYNPCNKKKIIHYIRAVGLLVVLTISNTILIHSIDDHISNMFVRSLLYFASNLTFIGLFYGICSYCNNKKRTKINNLVTSLNTLSKEQICANTSHKIRNPLQEILYALDILKQKLPSSSSINNLSTNQTSELLIIYNAIKQLERTADELLELSGTTQPISGFSINNPINSLNNKDINSLNILVVDDNEINRFFLKSMLEKLSHKVVTATNGQEAVNLVLNETTSIFNVIFIDIEMPIMDGITATRIIRKTFNKDILPIIACTSHGSADDLEAFKAAGMNDALLKPTNLNKVIYALSRLNINEPNIEPEALSSPSSLLKRPGSFSEGILNSYTSNMRLNYSDLNSSDVSEHNTPPYVNSKKMFPN